MKQKNSAIKALISAAWLFGNSGAEKRETIGTPHPSAATSFKASGEFLNPSPSSALNLKQWLEVTLPVQEEGSSLIRVNASMGWRLRLRGSRVRATLRGVLVGVVLHVAPSTSYPLSPPSSRVSECCEMDSELCALSAAPEASCISSLPKNPKTYNPKP